MTIQDQIKDLDERIKLQLDLIDRYIKAGRFAPDFYLDELYQLKNEHNNLVKKAKINAEHIIIIQC